MEQHIAYQFRLYPNKEQKELFAKTFGCVLFIWNQMLADEQYFYNATETFTYARRFQQLQKAAA